jgi:cytochrome c oxidase subunit III
MTEVSPDEVYADRQTRDHALHLGMWVFLGSETLLFAGLFGLYAAYRSVYGELFAEAVTHNDAFIGTVNTLVLIISSFLVAWSIHALRGGRRRTCIGALLIAILLGLTFLGLKSIEYAHHLAEGIAPGPHYTSLELPSQGARIFFTLYYAMTALHAIHVIAGITILAWLALRVRRRRTTPERHVELELGGLYWHLVDVVWIFLWPLLYLTR